MKLLKGIVIGLSKLEGIGLRSLIHDEFECSIELYDCFSDCERLSDRFDFYVISSEIFSANPEFFLPRNQKTIIVVSGKLAPKEGWNILGNSIDEADIEHFLKNFIRRLMKSDPQQGELSGREIEVLRMISEGKKYKEIADKLFISINTVITHKKNISSKLKINSLQGLSLYAKMNGII